MMNLHRAADALQNFEPLDRLRDPLMKVAEAVSPPGIVQDVLTGRFIGHPTHPPLTDVPVGFWLSAVVVDAISNGENEAADALIGLGIVAALPTAASGLADWKDTIGGEKRVGTAHALFNTAGLTGFAASLAARRAGNRGLGRSLSTVSTALMFCGAWLGGYLSFSLGIPTDETAFEQGPTDWADALSEEDVGEG